MRKVQNLRRLLEARASASPDRVFLLSENDGRQFTYAQFDKVVNQTAIMLAARGVGKGDVVSLLMPNGAEYVIAYFACFKLGAVAGPVNSLLKLEEMQFIVGNSEAKLMLFDPEFEEEASALKRVVPTLKRILAFGDVVATTKECAQDALFPDVAIDSNDDAIIIYTSGTTGKPKGCLLTHANLLANARQIVEWLGFTSDDRLLTIMPLFHMNAVTVTTMSALFAGGSTVVSPRFSASKFWDIVSTYKVTSFGSVATMLSMLLSKYPDGVPSTLNADRLRFAMCGSAPVPAEILRRFEEKFRCLVIEGYGLSESTCRSTFNPPDSLRRASSCGVSIGNEIKVVDEEDREVPHGQSGEIVLRGENIFKAYFKNPEATAHAFRGGWFHTGDIGYRDADGFFYIIDRKSDMIIRGGENIYPREIDELLYKHENVAEAAAVGVPHELYGEEVAAFVVLRNPDTSNEQDIIDFCKEHLADYKCPTKVFFLESLPKGPTGKVLKRALVKRN